MFANKLHRFFSPIIGDAAAKRLILNYSARVNRPPQQLTQEDLPEIGKYFAQNIQIFVGADQAQQIIGKLAGKLTQSAA